MYVCSRTNVVYRGLEGAQCAGGGRVPSLLDLPGVSAAGWTAAHLYKGSGSTDRDRQSLQNRLTAFLRAIFDKIKALKDSKHFLSPLSEVSPCAYLESCMFVCMVVGVAYNNTV